MIREGKRAKVIFLTILIAAAIGIPTVGAAPPDPTVRVEPSTLQVRPGEDFEVQVVIDDVEDLGGFELTIAYNPSVIDLQDASTGDFLGSTGRMAVPVGPDIDQEEGTMALGALAIGDSAGPTGTGLLATLTGRALQEGTSPIELQKFGVFNTAAERLSAQAQGGEVMVGAATAGPAQSPADPPRTTPRAWIVAGALLVVIAAPIVAFAVLRGRKRGSDTDSE